MINWHQIAKWIRSHFGTLTAGAAPWNVNFGVTQSNYPAKQQNSSRKFCKANQS